MNVVVIAYYPTLKLLNAAIWEHIKHYKNVQKALGVRFEPYYKPVWHRGQIAYEELKFKAVVTYQTQDGKQQTRRCSAQGWSVYAIAREGNQVRVTSWNDQTKELHEYNLREGQEGRTCSCAGFQDNPGPRGAHCEHLQVAKPELDQAPWLASPLYVYSMGHQIPHRLQPQPEELRTPEPASVSVVQLRAGLVPTPGFELVPQSGDRYQIVAHLGDRPGKTHKIGLGTVIQDGEWITFTDTSGRYGRSVTATGLNLRLICQDLLLRSRYKDWNLLPTEPTTDLPSPPLLPKTPDPTANLPSPEPRCRIRVEKDLNTGLYSLYNLETQSFLVENCPKSEVSKQAKFLVDQGHLVNAVDRTTGNWYNFQNGSWHYIGTKEISKIAPV